MKKYLLLVAVLALTAGGTLTASFRSPAAPAALPLPDEPADEAVEEATGEAAADSLAAAMKDTLVTPSAAGRVDFPHRYHYEEEEIACDECHHETNAATLHLPSGHDAYFDDFWLDCTICHRSDGETVLAPQACSECHPDAPRDEADETLSAKVAIHKNCEECHDFGTGAEASANCTYCHTGPKTSLRP